MTIEQLSSNKNTLIIDGKQIASEIIKSVASRTLSNNIRPGLAVILIGSDAASSVYVKNKSNRAKECGFESRQFSLDQSTSEKDVLALIAELNDDDKIHGILVQLPLPDQIDPHKVIQSISPEKDVDGFHYINAGKLMTGDTADALVPCTPAGALHLVKHALGNDLNGKHAVIIGRSNIVGKPMASLLLAQNCTVTIIHSRTNNPCQIAKQADIVIAAVGVPKLVTSDWIKPGAVVIDVGINRSILENGSSKLVGDVDFDSVFPIASAITPVPGGVGPMTISMLMENTFNAAMRKQQIK